MNPNKDKPKRYTSETLMRAIHERIVAEGCYAEAERIMDYFLPETYRKNTFSNYGFDVLATAHFGGSEGIYVDVYACGEVDESREEKRWGIGTYKTLGTSLQDMQIMGKLAGSITYYAFRVVNENLDAFEPDREKIAHYKAMREAQKK